MRFWKDKITEEKLAAMLRLEELYEERLKYPVCTTIRVFKGKDDDHAFWQWAKSLIASDEYKFLIFSLRENTIREMVGVSDAAKIIELNARLNMLAIIDKYLETGIEEHGKLQVLGIAKDEKGGAGLA
jgi:hypothetical protein